MTLTATVPASIPYQVNEGGVINTSTVPIASTAGLTDAAGQFGTYVTTYWWLFAGLGLLLVLLLVL